MSVKVHDMQVIIFLVVWYLRKLGQILSACVKPKHVCIVLWSPKNVTLGDKLFSAIYPAIYPAVCYITMQAKATQGGPKTAQQGKWYAVIHFTIDKPEKQRRGKIWSLAEH